MKPVKEIKLLKERSNKIKSKRKDKKKSEIKPNKRPREGEDIKKKVRKR